ncbi:CotS family spore coat protein [Haloimpatiens sp. FM7315]|uniref:CotS family spore coat protein n=1 Tax=Haloimpatiens sp. FM7315 TaxID=3298609 RepID=UPI003977828D
MYSSSKYNNEINDKEQHFITKIMRNYNLNVENIQKKRSVYKIKTQIGNVCLKKISRNRHKVTNGYNLVNMLYNQDFIYTPKYIKTVKKELIIKYKKSNFYLTEWIDGEECNMSDMKDMLNSIKLLGQFHVKCKNIDVKSLKLKNNLKDWSKDFNKKIFDLQRFFNFIEYKKIKYEFDNKYYEYMNNFSSRALSSLNLLNSSNYYKLCSDAKSYTTICHNSFYYQNVIKKENNYYLIDLNSIIIDLQISDLGKFIRRLMFKKNYKWDFNIAKSIINEYNSVNKLSKDELEVMLSLIIFPYKFWKLGNKRYIKHKNWNEAKYMHKLKKIIECDELQQKFLEDFLKYINSYY